jgi:hypothetical protein
VGHVRRSADGNLLDANIAVGSGTLKHPMLIVHGMSANPAVWSDSTARR